MDYKEFQEQKVDYLSGNLSDEEKHRFEDYLTKHPEHQEEFASAQFLWEGDRGEIPEPTSKMDTAFYTMLDSELKKEEKKSKSKLQKLESFFFGNTLKQLAYTLAILFLGFIVGNQFFTSDKNIEERVKVAQQETQEVRSQLVLTLLDQPSASKRLQAINEVAKMDGATEKILNALFSTLNNDSNVNVRLSAIESLKNYTEIPEVREGLVASIVNQKSPLVQVELADLMVALQEKKAVKSFKKLINEKDVHTSAKQKMEESIREIY
jgi:L-fucose mutarotase/ribose pyranase (RbsD/FucU family)